MTIKLTDAGKTLLTRCMAAASDDDSTGIVFKKIQYGNGADAGETATELSNLMHEAAVSSMKRSSDGSYVTLRVAFSNKDVETGFSATELGVMARDPDNSSNYILFAYGYEDESTAIYIPSVLDSTVETTESISVYVGSVEDITVELDSSLVFVAQQDFNDAMAERRISVYAVCDTAQATTAKEATADSFTLTDGAMVTVKFTNGIPPTTNITLDVNGTGAKYITPNNIDGWGSVDFGIEQGSMLTFVYDAETDYYVLTNEYASFCYYARYANYADALTAQAVSYDADEEALTIATD